MKQLILLLLILTSCIEHKPQEYQGYAIAVEYTDNQCDTIFYPGVKDEVFILNDTTHTLYSTDTPQIERDVKRFTVNKLEE